MKQIRPAVFETNSSSSHSISFSTKMDIDTSLVPDESGLLVIGKNCNKQFGWEIEEYNDAETKAMYAYIQARYSQNQDHIDMVYDVIIKQTGATEIIFWAEVDEYNSSDWAYIDHQSAYYESGFEPFSSSEQMRDFIFNRNVTLHTDNDNH